MNDVLKRLANRALLALGIGRVTATRTDRATPTAQVSFRSGETRDDVPLMGMAGFVSRPLPGADAVVAFIGGNRGGGVVIATGDRRIQVDLAPGEFGLMSDEGAGIIVRRGARIEIVAPGGLTHTGGFAAQGGALTHEGRNVGATHRHTGVNPGSGSSGETQV